MCGPSSAQNTVQSDQLDLTKQLMNENSQIYGQQSGILQTLNNTFAPILAQGPDQTGFGKNELTALNTQNTDTTAENFAQAQRTLNENRAAEGGGNTFEPSGAAASEDESLAATAEASKSANQNQITEANYAQGRQNFNTAARVLGTTASTLNPTGAANAATSSGSAASSTANTIAAQSNSVWSSVLGALGGVASTAIGNFGGGKSGAVPSVPMSMYQG